MRWSGGKEVGVDLPAEFGGECEEEGLQVWRWIGGCGLHPFILERICVDCPVEE